MVKLPHDLGADQIRILQEFRRLGTREMTAEQLAAVKHPAGGGEGAVAGLVEKGFVSRGEGGKLILQPPADELLAYNPMPLSERG